MNNRTENAQWAPEDLPMLLAAYAGLYDGSPESLLSCLGEFLRLPMFEYRHLVNDQTAEVFEKLREAVLRYERAEARTLDEAFGVKRPKGFTRAAEEFNRTHGYRLVMDVWKLTQSGDITPTAALKQLAETDAYPKSFETLYNLYRDDFTEPARLIYGLMSLPFKNSSNK